MQRLAIGLLSFFMTLSCTAAIEKAVFAGGCFWCMESDFDQLPGVISTTSGFDGGTTKNPTYELVSAGNTNYAESVLVEYDTTKLNYQYLVDYFFRHIDPTVKDSQFCDHGHQYRSAIFYLNENQKNIALASKAALERKFPVVATEVAASTRFYPAEEYHQNYYQKNPIRYKYYRYRCGRDSRVQEIWNNENK